MWKISNQLSLLRLFLTIPIAFALWYDLRIITLIIAFIAILSDYFDGYLARKLNQITDLGKILDPLADKVMVLTVVFIMFIKNDIPLWLASIIIIRDIVIFIGGIMIKRKNGNVPVSNYWGKYAVSAIALYLVLKVVNINYPEIVLVFIVTSLLVISFVTYIYRAFIIYNPKSD
jgi:CDP-diacylglycerol--glycerol-3-phosphate 3-phosphatidyltransferase